MTLAKRRYARPAVRDVSDGWVFEAIGDLLGSTCERQSGQDGVALPRSTSATNHCLAHRRWNTWLHGFKTTDLPVLVLLWGSTVSRQIGHEAKEVESAWPSSQQSTEPQIK